MCGERNIGKESRCGGYRYWFRASGGYVVVLCSVLFTCILDEVQGMGLCGEMWICVCMGLELINIICRVRAEHVVLNTRRQEQTLPVYWGKCRRVPAECASSQSLAASIGGPTLRKYSQAVWSTSSSNHSEWKDCMYWHCITNMIINILETSKCTNFIIP